MALSFVEADDDRVTYGDTATLQDIWHTASTFIFWLKPLQTATTFKVYWRIKRNIISGSDGTSMAVSFRYSGDDADCTSNAILTTGVWSFVAVTKGGAGTAPTIYHGTLAAAPTDQTATSRVSTGTPEAETGSSFDIGSNVGTSGQGAGADIAMSMFYNTVLTLGQLTSIWMRPQIIKSGCLLYNQYGFSGTTSQVDWSGNGHTGTIDGATIADHVPLGPPFGFDAGFPFVTAAVGGLSIPVGMNQYFRQHSQPWV